MLKIGTNKKKSLKERARWRWKEVKRDKKTESNWASKQASERTVQWNSEKRQMCDPSTTLLIGIKWDVDERLSDCIACNTLWELHWNINVKSMFELTEMSNNVLYSIQYIQSIGTCMSVCVHSNVHHSQPQNRSTSYIFVALNKGDPVCVCVFSLLA